MSFTRSPEIEAVARRIMTAWPIGDRETMSNLFSSDSRLRVLGFDDNERYRGPDEFMKVFGAQMGETPAWTIRLHEVEAFEDGSTGWAILHSTIVTPETETPKRDTGVFRLEDGAWRVVQWHNSIAVPNRQIFGVELTTTLDNLVTSVLEESSDLGGSSGSEGTMTLVFTDIEDSTALAQATGDLAWAEIVASHEAAIRRITTAHGGTVVKLLGDGSMLAFESARAALRTSVEIQRIVADQPFTVRIGIHTGEVIRTTDDLFGITVNKAARVAMTTDGGGITVSATTRDLVGSMDGIRFEKPRTVTLKGLSDKHQIMTLKWD